VAEISKAGKWSEMELHDEYLELCALSTAGDLTKEEERRLQVHLSACADCREALKEFEAAAAVGMPLLASKLAGMVEADRSASVESGSSTAPEQDEGSAGGTVVSGSRKRGFAFAHRNGYTHARVNWRHVWLPFAACVLLSIALATYTYRVGKSRRSPVVSLGPVASAGPSEEAIEQQISDASHDRQVLEAQLAGRDRVITDLRRQIEQQSAALDEMKVAQTNLEASIKGEEGEKQQAVAGESSLTGKLDAAQASVQKLQAELESAQQQRSQEGSQGSSLEAQITDLNGELREREQTINKQDDLLSHDRDIRDLMGARDLYIAEVYDVGRDGATQKPFGRVFYTMGKSLVFYAYDLDEQPGVRNATTFQAWGRRGVDRQQALNMGILFQDNAAKKRWVLKFDDAKALEQIDAVFVTVEPNGGSNKPSGKPLLFAYLKVDPNHP
jgi:hypothetical protein